MLLSHRDRSGCSGPILEIKDSADVWLLMMYVAYDICRLMLFVAYDICCIMMCVAYEVFECVAYRVCRSAQR